MAAAVAAAAETHEEIFKKFIEEEIAKSKNSTAIYRDIGTKIITALQNIKNGVPVNPNLKQRIKKRKFTLRKEDDKDEEILCCNGIKVVFAEDFYDVINTVHSEMGHTGIQKTWHQLKQYHACIPREAITEFVNTCSVCNLRQHQVIIIINFN